MKKLKILLIFVFSFLFINNVSALDTDLNTAGVQDSAFESMISGFDESYKPYLRYLHTIHPNWKFTPMNTNLDFNTSVIEEKKVSSINISSGKCEQNPFYETESGWCIANDDTTKYYLDSRNFLSERYIFMFQNLNNDDKYDEATVQSILNGSIMSGISALDSQTFASIFVEAGNYANVSPLYLASLSMQEVGRGGTNTNGTPFEYNGINYSGLFNFFNIGAYSSESNPMKAGLVFANGGSNGSSTSYLRPWTSPKKAIMGGASYIGQGYIASTQNTMYLKKFNVSPKSRYIYAHQYQANLAAPMSEASKIFNGLKSNNLLDRPYNFVIPQYYNMPNGTLVPTGDNNNSGQTIKPSFLSILNARTTAGYLRGYQVGTTIGTIKNLVGNNAVVVIKNAGGNIMDDGNIIGTGYTINISNSDGSDTYTYVMYGDLNGDGEINSADLLKLRKYLIGSEGLDGAFKSSAYINSDGEINSADLLNLRQYLIGTNTINQ